MGHRKSIFSGKFYAVLFLVGIGSFFIHELAHWLAGDALGYDMVAAPNHVSSRSPMSVRDQGLVSAVRPLLTIAQAA